MCKPEHPIYLRRKWKEELNAYYAPEAMPATLHAIQTTSSNSAFPLWRLFSSIHAHLLMYAFAMTKMRRTEIPHFRLRSVEISFRFVFESNGLSSRAKNEERERSLLHAIKHTELCDNILLGLWLFCAGKSFDLWATSWYESKRWNYYNYYGSGWDVPSTDTYNRSVEWNIFALFLGPKKGIDFVWQSIIQAYDSPPNDCHCMQRQRLCR